MPIPTGPVETWTTSQINSILPTEIPNIIDKLVKLTGKQFSALSGMEMAIYLRPTLLSELLPKLNISQINALDWYQLTGSKFAYLSYFSANQVADIFKTQGSGVLTGSWFDAPKNINVKILAKAIAAQSATFWAGISLEKWKKLANTWQPKLLSELLPLLSNSQVNSVDWYQMTGRKFTYLSYLSASQISGVLQYNGPGVLTGSWGDAVKNVSSNILSAAIAEQTASFISKITADQWRQLFAWQPNLMMQLISFAGASPALNNIDWYAVATGSGMVKGHFFNSTSVAAWGVGAKLSPNYYTDVINVSGTSAFINRGSGGILDIVILDGNVKWVYVQGAGGVIQGKSVYVNNCKVIDYSNSQYYEGFIQSNFDFFGQNIQTALIQNSVLTFHQGASAGLGTHPILDSGPIFDNIGGNKITMERGAILADVLKDEKFTLNGGAELSNVYATDIHGWINTIDTHASTGDTVDAKSGNNKMSLVNAKVYGDNNTIAAVLNDEIYGNSNRVNIDIGNGTTTVMGNKNNIYLAQGWDYLLPNRTNVAIIKITDTADSDNNIYINKNVKTVILNGEYATVNANSALAGAKRLTIDVTNLKSGTIYKYANENLMVVGNADKHIQLLVQSMASFFSDDAQQAYISTKGGASTIGSNQLLTVSSYVIST